MRGLIVKDMLIMRKNLRTYAVFMGFYLIMSALDLFSISFTTAIIQIIVMMLPMGAFSYDEMAKWDRYAMSLPTGRRAVVGGRYCFALILALGAALYGLLVSVVLSILSSQDAMMENLLTVLVSLGLGLLYCDILLPLCYKLGPERARPYMYLVVFLPVILLFGGAQLGMFDALDLSFLNRMPEAVLVGAFSHAALIPLLGLGLSYLISCRIIEGKEY